MNKNALTIGAEEVKNLVSKYNNLAKGYIMASNTQQTRTRRALKLKKMGKKRKNKNENQGTTPKFPIHKDK